MHDDGINDNGDGISGGVDDKDANNDNDEPDESGVDMDAEEDTELNLDLERQDNKDIADLYLVLYNGVVAYYQEFIIVSTIINSCYKKTNNS